MHGETQQTVGDSGRASAFRIRGYPAGATILRRHAPCASSHSNPSATRPQTWCAFGARISIGSTTTVKAARRSFFFASAWKEILRSDPGECSSFGSTCDGCALPRRRLNLLAPAPPSGAVRPPGGGGRLDAPPDPLSLGCTSSFSNSSLPRAIASRTVLINRIRSAFFAASASAFLSSNARLKRSPLCRAYRVFDQRSAACAVATLCLKLFLRAMLYTSVQSEVPTASSSPFAVSERECTCAVL